MTATIDDTRLAPAATLDDYRRTLESWGFARQAGLRRKGSRDYQAYSAPKGHHGRVLIPSGSVGRCPQNLVNTACAILRVKPADFWAGPPTNTAPDTAVGAGSVAAPAPATTPSGPRPRPSAPKTPASLRQSHTATVLSTLSLAGHPMGLSDIAAASAARGYSITKTQVSGACTSLARTGEIERVRSGIYRAASVAPPANRVDIRVVTPEQTTPTSPHAPTEDAPVLAPAALPADADEAFQRLFPDGVNVRTPQELAALGGWMAATTDLLAAVRRGVHTQCPDVPHSTRV